MLCTAFSQAHSSVAARPLPTESTETSVYEIGIPGRSCCAVEPPRGTLTEGVLARGRGSQFSRVWSGVREPSASATADHDAFDPVIVDGSI